MKPCLQSGIKSRIVMGLGLAVALAFPASTGFAAGGAAAGTEAAPPAAPAAPSPTTPPTHKPRHHVVTRQMAFESAKLGKSVKVPVKVTSGPGVSARTGVQCKTGGHSCTSTSHTCTDLADDMKACCGDVASVKTASCNEIKE